MLVDDYLLEQYYTETGMGYCWMGPVALGLLAEFVWARFRAGGRR